MEENTGITPQGLLSRPRLSELNRWHYQEFEKLSRDRTFNEVGPAPLNTGTIRSYYDAFALHECMAFEDFYEKMVLMDNLWMAQVTEKRKREAAKKPPPSKASPIPRRRR